MRKAYFICIEIIDFQADKKIQLIFILCLVFASKICFINEEDSVTASFASPLAPMSLETDRASKEMKITSMKFRNLIRTFIWQN